MPVHQNETGAGLEEAEKNFHRLSTIDNVKPTARVWYMQVFADWSVMFENHINPIYIHPFLPGFHEEKLNMR